MSYSGMPTDSMEQPDTEREEELGEEEEELPEEIDPGEFHDFELAATDRSNNHCDNCLPIQQRMPSGPKSFTPGGGR